MKRGWWLLIVWTVQSAVLLAVTWIVFGAYRIAPPDRLDDGERTRLVVDIGEVERAQHVADFGSGNEASNRHRRSQVK